MVIRHGNMWASKPDLWVVTTNSYVTLGVSLPTTPRLAMGRGAAKEAVSRFPGVDKYFGTEITLWEKRFNGDEYGFICHPTLPIGIFQVKYHFKCKASTRLIRMSTLMLGRYSKGGMRIAMNFPGIGYGGLTRSVVLPLICELPDNVEVWLHG